MLSPAVPRLPKASKEGNTPTVGVTGSQNPRQHTEEESRSGAHLFDTPEAYHAPSALVSSGLALGARPFGLTLGAPAPPSGRPPLNNPKE
jgi:hypothetical protein